MTNYQVSEMFNTVQGEGHWAGRKAFFIRLQGCTVGCPWCDTKYTWRKGGTRMTVESIVSQIPSGTEHVVITGGEPTLYNLDELILALRKRRIYIQIETSGQNDLKGKERPEWITWSPKKNLNYDASDRFRGMVQEVKWVVDAELEYDVVYTTWNWFLENTFNYPWFVLMPEGCPPKPENIAKTLEWIMRPEVPAQRWKFGDRLQYRIGVR